MNADQIEKLLADVTAIYDELKEEKRAQAEAEEAHRQKIQSLIALMNEEGITPEDILGSTGTTKPTRQVKPKYRRIDNATGKALEWSGRGRTPKWITEHEEKGGSRDDFLIVGGESA
ncbi:H-NS histone family protein [Marinobacterium sp. A346]|uniref:H-NS histone family protein n=2 Tax=Marinobacterium weihaiense TaxID=2851016 RepID=A0ABS6MF71_9GAMM|nr:H-NS histone family protein [Marinobacterium weihaiense]